MKVVVAVGGASGSIYAKRLLDELAAHVAARKATIAAGAKLAPHEIGLVFSSAGSQVWEHEIGEVPTYSSFKKYGLRDFRAPFASGSAGWEAMVVIPCSTGGLARIALAVELIEDLDRGPVSDPRLSRGHEARDRTGDEEARRDAGGDPDAAQVVRAEQHLLPLRPRIGDRAVQHRIERAEVPDVPFGIGAGVAAPAVVVGLELEQDLGPGRARSDVMSVGILDHGRMLTCGPLAAIPLRRNPWVMWFRPIARVGARGADEYPLDLEAPGTVRSEYQNDVTFVIRPRRSGELFLYVNDAVVGLHRDVGFFYESNQGSATLKVRRMR